MSLPFSDSPHPDDRIANTGKYKFNPLSRTYSGVVTDQTAQNYDALIFGDVASGFVYLPEGSSQDAAGHGAIARKIPLPR